MKKTFRTELPVYLANFNLFDFDTRSLEKRYRIVSETCDIEINKSVKELIDFIELNEGKTFSFFLEKYSKDKKILKEHTEKTINDLYDKGILNTEKQKKKEIKEEDFHRNKMKNLWFRKRLIDTEKHESIFRFFSFIFNKPVVIAVLSFFFVLDTVFLYKFFFTSWNQQLTFFSSIDYFYLSIFVWISLFLHEIGHIAAAKRYNAKTGGIGIGIYFYMLVGYADVHETWNLPRNERQVISIAGFYWNIISVLPIYLLCFHLNSKVLTDFLILFHYSFLLVFNPFLKMDGYWFLCDILGVPNLQSRVKIYLYKYLPSKFVKRLESVKNPFKSYPESVRKGVNVYIIVFSIFMLIFLPALLYKAVVIVINFEDMIINPFSEIITNWDNTIINQLIRNCFILTCTFMIVQGYLRKTLTYLREKAITNNNLFFNNITDKS